MTMADQVFDAISSIDKLKAGETDTQTLAQLQRIRDAIEATAAAANEIDAAIGAFEDAQGKTMPRFLIAQLDPGLGELVSGFRDATGRLPGVLKDRPLLDRLDVQIASQHDLARDLFDAAANLEKLAAANKMDDAVADMQKVKQRALQTQARMDQIAAEKRELKEPPEL